MRFGLFGGAQSRRRDGDPACGFCDYVETCVEAEALGFDSTFLVEHHFSGTGQVSAPLDLLASGKDAGGQSPIIALYHGTFTLTVQAGTLTLTCYNKFTDFSDPAAVLGSGSCANHRWDGTYAGVSGPGPLSTVSNFVIPIPTQVVTISLNIV